MARMLPPAEVLLARGLRHQHNTDNITCWAAK